MKCAVCNSELVNENCSGMLYWRCPKCDRSCSMMSQIQKAFPQIQSYDFFPVVMLSREKPLLCINCGSEMNTRTHKGHIAKLIQFCPQCGWCGFDSIERIRLIEHEDILKKKEQFLEDLGHDIENSIESRRFFSDISEVSKKLSRRVSYITFLFFSKFAFILPISSERDKSKTPWTVFGLIIINTFIFFLMVIRFESIHSLVPYMLLPDDIRHGNKLFGLISYCFLHSSFLHLAGNMYFLWLFGASVEERVRPLRFIFFYMLSGILAGLGFVFLKPENIIPALGSSGAISAVMGAYLIFFPKRNVKTLIGLEAIDIPAIFYLAAWIIWQFINSLLSSKVMLSNIGWDAHITGFFTGVIFAVISKRIEKNRH